MTDEWTVERHLQDKPVEVVALYHRFIELAEACGPFTYAVAKTAVSLKASRGGFAGAAPTMKALDGHFDLQRQISDPRIRRSSPYTGHLFVHQFRVRSLDKPTTSAAAGSPRLTKLDRVLTSRSKAHRHLTGRLTDPCLGLRGRRSGQVVRRGPPRPVKDR